MQIAGVFHFRNPQGLGLSKWETRFFSCPTQKLWCREQEQTSCRSPCAELQRVSWDGRRRRWRCMRIAEWRRTMLMTTTLSCFVVVEELCGWGPLHSSPQCRSGDVRWWLRPERWPCHLHSHPNCAITSQPLKGEKHGCTASTERWWSCLPALAEQSSSSIPNLKEKKGKGFRSGWWSYLYKYPWSQGQSWITCDASNVSSSYGSVDFVFGCPFWHCFMYGPRHPCEVGQMRGEMVHCYETHLGWACQPNVRSFIKSTHTRKKLPPINKRNLSRGKVLSYIDSSRGCFDYLMVHELFVWHLYIPTHFSWSLL